ncbi:MAG: ATP-binding protein, partial [Alphaproteobacteria bacterium]|nr:ATP-binding protein [Alphaproteobacteria bacterium]
MGALLTVAPVRSAEVRVKTKPGEVYFAARLFADARWSPGGSASDRTDICRRIVAGGFPEALARDSADRRDAWFRSYVMSILQRDVRDLANIDGLLEMPRL